MSSRVDQLVFGYRDGHELLAGSTKIGPRLESELLPHVDARFEGETEHYLVGTWVKQLDRFLLGRIWPAPELPRPGAVWSHALLLDRETLERSDPLALVGHLRRPGLDDLGSFEAPTEIQPEAPELIDVSEPLMATLCLVGYAPHQRNSVVIWHDPRESELALLALWRRLPKRTRPEFSFRTRDRARTGKSPYRVQVANVLAGRSASQEAALIDARVQPEESWAVALAQASRDPDDALAVALDSFARTRADSIALAESWPMIESEDVAGILSWLARDEMEAAQDLAKALFRSLNAPDDLWRLPEADRIQALLRNDRLAPLGGLLSAARLDAAWISEPEAMLFLLDRHSASHDKGEIALIHSAMRYLNDDDLIARAGDPAIFRAIVAERSGLLGSPDLWRVVDGGAPDRVIDQVLAQSGVDLASALVDAEAWSLLVRAIELGQPPGAIAERVARRDPEDLALWEYLFEDSAAELAESLANAKGPSPEALVLAAASLPRKYLREVPLRRWAAAGRIVHARGDEAAQRAAARLVAHSLEKSSEASRRLLIDCFGPTHRALETRTLEPKTRLELEARLPKLRSKSASETERLDRALIESMERSEWSQGDLTRALETAGPQARRVVKLVGKKGALRRRVEGSLEELKGLRR